MRAYSVVGLFPVEWLCAEGALALAPDCGVAGHSHVLVTHRQQQSSLIKLNIKTNVPAVITLHFSACVFHKESRSSAVQSDVCNDLGFGPDPRQQPSAAAIQAPASTSPPKPGLLS